MMRLYHFFRDAVGREVEADVRHAIGDSDTIVIDLIELSNDRTFGVPTAKLEMDKKAAVKLVALLAGVVTLSGCSTIGRVCDQAEARLQYTHVSHPLAGAPFGPGTEEDALHSVGPMGRCDVGRAYVEGGLGWKVRDGGFYGPDLTGTLNVGVRLWELK